MIKTEKTNKFGMSLLSVIQNRIENNVDKYDGEINKKKNQE